MNSSLLNQWEQSLGEYMILASDDWSNFMNNYCPGIPYNIAVDWTTQCLIAEITQGAKPAYTALSPIQSVSIIANGLDVQESSDTSTTIYALNNDSTTHFAIQVLVVNKNDIPLDSPSIKNEIYVQ